MSRRQPVPDLTRLDRRKTGYRFDLEADLPWTDSEQPGLYAGPYLLSRLGIRTSSESVADAEAQDALQWGLALATAQAFVALESDVTAFVTQIEDADTSRSLQLLLEEEHKHIAMFQRVAEDLRRARPEWVADFDEVWRPPVSWADVKKLIPASEANQMQWLVWLATLFFEEYTVWIHHALQEDSSLIQPLWLKVHACHRKEEVQHVATDAAYLHRCGLEPEVRRRLGRGFLLFLETHFDRLLCLDVLDAFMRRRSLGHGVLSSDRRLASLPFQRDLLEHAAFRQSRNAMPALSLYEPRVQGQPAAHVLMGPDAVEADLSLGDCLAQAVANPDSPEIIFVAPGGQEERWSYGELLTRARRRLAGLSELGVRQGDMVLLMTPQPQEFLVTFWACIMGGVLPAPLAPPALLPKGDANFDRLEAVHRSSGCGFVITEQPLQGELSRLSKERGLDIRYVVANSLDREVETSPLLRLQSSDVAFVQFSSGSTSTPRGVRLTHGNIISNARAMVAHRTTGQSEVFVSWLPLFHDMGLIGYHLTPLVTGATQVLTTPQRFIRNPVSWLRALDHYGGTVTGGSNFSLDHLMARLSKTNLEALDLSRVHCWLIGAEPISIDVLQACTDTLARAGLPDTALCPGYGLAEATLAATMTPVGEAAHAWYVDRDSLARGTRIRAIDQDHARACALVACGAPIQGLSVRVVDADGTALPSDRVGEIQLRGPTVTVGILNAPKGPPGPGEGWLATGDLGVSHAGRLYVTGRAQDTFFVAGRTLYAHDIEAVATEIPEVKDGCAGLVVHPVDSRGIERRTLCIVAKNKKRPEAAMTAVIRHVAARTGVALDEVLCVTRAELPRTTSGKLQRFKLGEHVRAGKLKSGQGWAPGAPSIALAPAAPTTSRVPTASTALVAQIWSVVLGIESIDHEADFQELGGTSLRAADVHARLEEALGRHLGPELLTHGRTVKSMVAYLDKSEESKSEPTVASAPVTTRARPPEPAPASVSTAEPIAVVGMALRLPGASDGDELWTLLKTGRCMVGPVPASRFDAQALQASLDGVKRVQGAFVDELRSWDPTIYSISDEVAKALDPQHRLFLDVAHEALCQTLAGTKRVGVFAACGDNEYALRYLAQPGLAGPHALLGALKNMVAARVASVFGLTGPALTVDSACSSSLAAVHLGLQSLRTGDCDLALVGGVQLNLTARAWEYFAKAGLLSKDGVSRPFDRDASGLVPGEGAVALVLKPLKAAQEDNDVIHGLIMGSAMNNDGGALSGTAPNPKGQREVIEAAWRRSGLSPSTVGYVEGHAAGTMIGDALEAGSLAEVFAGNPDLPIGSAKSNFGHTLAASGVTSLAKVLLALKNQYLPPTVGCENPAERIRFASNNLRPVLQGEAWRAQGTPRRAGIDSFGLGGTNVHVVVQEAPAAPPEAHRGPVLYAQAGLGDPSRVAEAEAQANGTIGARAASALRRAQWGTQRRSWVVRDDSELQEGLHRTEPSALPACRVAFVVPGPGAQQVGMGWSLAASEPTFGKAWRECLIAFEARGVGLEATNDPAAIDTIEVAQPAVFAFAYASWRWLCDLGLKPDLVLGHSAGEILAAHIAGVMSFEDAVSLVVARGNAMAAAPSGGAAVVFAAVAEVRGVIAQTGLRVTVASVNAPQQTVISGLEADVQSAVAAFEATGLAARRLPINTPAHSSLMAPVAEALALKVRDIEFRAPECDWMSSFKAEPMGKPEPEYWSEQLLDTVQFSGAVTQALKVGIDLFIELSPTAGLSACIGAIAQTKATAVAVGVRGEDEVATALQCVGDIWSSGINIQLQRLAQGRTQPSPLVRIATQPRRLWLHAPVAQPPPVQGHWLEGGLVASIEDHRTGGKTTAPAALLVDQLLARNNSDIGVGLARVLVRAPLELQVGQRRRVHIEQVSEALHFSTSDTSGEQPVLHLSAETVLEPPRTFDRLDLPAVRGRCPQVVAPEQLYSLLAASGFEVGARMRGVHRVQVSTRELIAELRTPVGGDSGHWIDPALLDGASQAVAACFIGESAALSPYLGFSMGSISIWKPVNESCVAVVQLRSSVEAAASVLRYDILLTSPQGELLAEIRDFSAKRYEPSGGSRLPVPRPRTLRPQTSGFWGQSIVPSSPPSVLPVPAAVPAAESGRPVFEPPPSRGPEPQVISSSSVDEVMACLRQEVSARVRRSAETIGLDEPLAHLGLDSMKAVDLVAALERRYQVTLPATFLFEARTLRDAANKLFVAMGGY